MTAIDLVGPKGYVHGWIFVGTSAAAQMHGRSVLGVTREGHKVPGIYDHPRSQVVSPFGKRTDVTSVQPLREQGQDWRKALASYDKRVASGSMKFGPSGYAQGNLGQKAADRDLINFVKQHVHALANARQRGISLAAPTSAAGRRAAYKAGRALPPPGPGAPPGYPITSSGQWEKARQAVGRVGSPGRRAALARLLRKTAPQFGKTKALHKSWAAPGGSKNMAYDSMAEIGSLATRRVLNLADGPTTYSREAGEDVRCPSCGKYNSDDAKFCDQCGAKMPNSAFSEGDGDNLDSSGPEALQTPASQSLQSATGFNRGQIGLANTLDFAGPAITAVTDLMISREDGKATVRHRRGGVKIGTIGHNDAGQWSATLGDGDKAKSLSPHTHQRAALTELIGTWNSRALTPQHRAGSAVQPAPEQTPLMQRYGVPAVRALATPSNGASDGPRATGSSASDGGDLAGLSPRGVTIYKKLRARNFPPDRALAFARRSQNFGSKG